MNFSREILNNSRELSLPSFPESVVWNPNNHRVFCDLFEQLPLIASNVKNHKES